MKRAWVVLVAGAVVCATQFLTPADSLAAQSFTITGPAIVNYAVPVELTGTTPAPYQPVVVHEGPSSNGASSCACAFIRSDVLGRFTTTFKPQYLTTYFWATSGSAHTTTHSMALVKATCSFSGPAFSSVPTYGYPVGVTIPFAVFNVARNGLWAGVEFNGVATITLIDWRSGQHNPTVLDTFNYAGGGAYNPNGYYPSVQAVGITASGGVVVRAQLTNSPNYRNGGYIYQNGRRYSLATEPGWTSVEPFAVTDDGAIIGAVRTGPSGNGTYTAVAWNASGADPQPLINLGRTGEASMSVDGDGDIFYYAPSPPAQPGTWLVRTHTGRVVPFATVVTGLPAAGGATNSFYGNDLYAGIARWDVTPTTPLLQVASVVAPSGQPRMASASGDLLVDYIDNNAQEYLITHTGKLVAIPAPQGVGLNSLNTLGYTSMIAPSGIVAYTGWHDGLIHFMSCS